ncbi:helix-turn-helix transcriptional regulator [Peribacillus psychrosaccharolyticus]|uniref:helix-turn-helix domain-containing protein n=1 Tax=Peribacillus psychrosaccharolyticus TaxID=1407 RepID=UPI003D2A4E4B
MNGLELLVETAGINFKDVAEYLGISPKTVNDWVKGRSEIPKKHWKRLADGYGIDIELIKKKDLSNEDNLKMRLMYYQFTNEPIKTDDFVYNSNEEVIQMIQDELEIVEKIESQKNRLDATFREYWTSHKQTKEDSLDNGSYSRMIAQFVDVLESGEQSKLEGLKHVIYFLSNLYSIEEDRWEEINPFLNGVSEREFYRELNALLKKYKNGKLKEEE